MAIPLSRRLAMARQHAGYKNEAALAKVASKLAGKQIRATEVEALESGAQKLSRHLIELAAACKVRPDWLVFGEEPMVPGGEVSEVSANEMKLTADEMELVKAWRQLDVRVVKPALWALIEEWAAITRQGLVEWERQRASDPKKG